MNQVNWNQMQLTDEHQAHLNIMIEALRIYLNKDLVRGDLWRTRPPSHKLEMIQEKHDRAERALPAINGDELISQDAMDEYEDDLLDIINFAVFALRQVREGQRG
jgi:hypothetical protein